ncbi:hypothetical protein MP228_005962 [Amoeboaphelidium protococcarum]|nr:hypothetical protein MP228_005962 [Amoeboaphelidium protococcarum]
MIISVVPLLFVLFLQKTISTPIPGNDAGYQVQSVPTSYNDDDDMTESAFQWHTDLPKDQQIKTSKKIHTNLANARRVTPKALRRRDEQDLHDITVANLDNEPKMIIDLLQIGQNLRARELWDDYNQDTESSNQPELRDAICGHGDGEFIQSLLMSFRNIEDDISRFNYIFQCWLSAIDQKNDRDSFEAILESVKGQEDQILQLLRQTAIYGGEDGFLYVITLLKDDISQKTWTTLPPVIMEFLPSDDTQSTYLEMFMDAKIVNDPILYRKVIVGIWNSAFHWMNASVWKYVSLSPELRRDVTAMAEGMRGAMTLGNLNLINGMIIGGQLTETSWHTLLLNIAHGVDSWKSFAYMVNCPVRTLKNLRFLAKDLNAFLLSIQQGKTFVDYSQYLQPHAFSNGPPICYKLVHNVDFN